MSPTAGEIVDFFKAAMKENRTVGRKELLADTFSHAVSAGLSCLAALPSQVQDLIPEPYSWMSNATVEAFYASCMDPEDNCFDMKRFELLCEEHISEIAAERGSGTKMEAEINRHGRRILTGDHFWTVIARQNAPLPHPFDPPRPFSERLSELKPNPRIKVSRSMATSEPRPRSVWSKGKELSQKREPKSRIARHEPMEVNHANLGDLLKTESGNDASIQDVQYMLAYQEFKPDRKKSRRKRVQFELTPPHALVIPAMARDEANGENRTTTKKLKKRLDFDTIGRMREFKIVPPPCKPVTNVEGYTALLLLNQLHDAQMIDVLWKYTTPSASSYASVDPYIHEHVKLIVNKGRGDGKAVLHEDLLYEQDRNTNHVSRQSLKQHLSSFALCDILGPQKRWSEMKFKEITDYLLRKNKSKKP
jgi:hypothetical protein